MDGPRKDKRLGHEKINIFSDRTRRTFSSQRTEITVFTPRNDNSKLTEFHFKKIQIDRLLALQQKKYKTESKKKKEINKEYN